MPFFRTMGQMQTFFVWIVVNISMHSPRFQIYTNFTLLRWNKYWNLRKPLHLLYICVRRSAHEIYFQYNSMFLSKENSLWRHKKNRNHWWGWHEDIGTLAYGQDGHRSRRKRFGNIRLRLNRNCLPSEAVVSEIQPKLRLLYSGL